MDSGLPADLRPAVALGGETGRCFGALDWAAHPLGDPAGWSAAVRAQVAAGCATLPTSTVCARLVTAMSGSDGYNDDIAIVAVRPCGTTMISHIDAIPANFAGEALANAIEHGSDRDMDRTVTIEGFAKRDEVTITVGGTGHWPTGTATDRSGNRGRGLVLIHGLADHVGTDRTPLGTRVTMTSRRRSRPTPAETDERRDIRTDRRPAPGSVARAAMTLLGLPFHDSVDAVRRAAPDG